MASAFWAVLLMLQAAPLRAQQAFGPFGVLSGSGAQASSGFVLAEPDEGHAPNPVLPVVDGDSVTLKGDTWCTAHTVH